MGNKINSKVKKSNYERGLKLGNKVYCGQDLRELVGMRIAEVQSNDIDSEVVLWVEDEERQLAVYFDDICFDGEHMSIMDHTNNNCDILLKPVTEDELKAILNMPHYYNIKIANEIDEEIGIHQLYCNNPALEGTEQFYVKNLYIFYDGRIMTERELCEEDLEQKMMKEELDARNAEEEKKLGVGSEEFLRRHREIMEACDRLERSASYGKNTKDADN